MSYSQRGRNKTTFIPPRGGRGRYYQNYQNNQNGSGSSRYQNSNSPSFNSNYRRKDYHQNHRSYVAQEPKNEPIQEIKSEEIQEIKNEEIQEIKNEEIQEIKKEEIEQIKSEETEQKVEISEAASEMPEQYPVSVEVEDTVMSTSEQSEEEVVGEVGSNNETPEPVVPAGKTVFEDPENFTIYHDLEYQWTLYIKNTENVNDKNWNDAIKPVTSFRTIENFWRLFNYIEKMLSGRGRMQMDLMLFKDNIEPKWEHPANHQGGACLVNLPDKDLKLVEDAWMNLVMACIGERFEDGDQINGCMLNVKKKEIRLSLWIRDTPPETVDRITSTFGCVLKLRSHRTEFRPHEVVQKKSRFYRN